MSTQPEIRDRGFDNQAVPGRGAQGGRNHGSIARIHPAQLGADLALTRALGGTHIR